MALEKLAEKSGSKSQLRQAISAFEDVPEMVSLLAKCTGRAQVLNLADVPDDLFIWATQRLVDGAFSTNQEQRAVDAQVRLVKRLPDRLEFKTGLAISYHSMGKGYFEQAKRLFYEVILAEPNNGLANAYYGFLLKTVDDDLEGGLEYLRKGVRSREAGTLRHIFHSNLADALTRLGHAEEASVVHKQGAELGIFLSPIQRSNFNVAGLTARPYWTVEQTGYGAHLDAIRSEWRVIRAEALNLLNSNTGLFKHEDEKLSKEGDWRIYMLYRNGKRKDDNCRRAPKTCAIVDAFTDATGCKRGQIKFSVMHAGTVVYPHCGPTNCRIRAHLGLQVPDGAHIRVAGETRTWTEGEWLVLDDSFEHEVWNDGDDTRVILIVDFWHPDLSAQQRQTLQPITVNG